MFLLGIFGANWKLLLYAVGALALGYFIYSWDSRGRAAISLQIENQVLQQNVLTMEKQKNMWLEAEQAAEARIQEFSQITTSTNQIIEDSRNAPKTDDAKLSPVLRRGINSIDKLFHAAPGSH